MVEQTKLSELAERMATEVKRLVLEGYDVKICFESNRHIISEVSTQAQINQISNEYKISVSPDEVPLILKGNFFTGELRGQVRSVRRAYQKGDKRKLEAFKIALKTNLIEVTQEASDKIRQLDRVFALQHGLSDLLLLKK